MARKKLRSGTWVTREMIISKAFWALSGTAKGMLLQFLTKRNMDKKHNLLNKKNITMTYKELENLHGCDSFGKPQGLSRGSIARALRDLMAKGFIEIVRQGGAYQKDKTIYGLTDDWKWWTRGTVIRKKSPGKKAGYHALQKRQPPQTEPYTPPQTEPKTKFRVS